MTAHLTFQALDDQLEFDGRRFPAVVAKPSFVTSLTDASQWIAENIDMLETELSESGVILFRGFPVSDANSFDCFSAAFGYPNFTYKESLSNAVRINFTERVFTANEAPNDVEIFLHHEMAQTPVSPNKLFFFCKSAAEKGGATPVCRSDQLYKELKRVSPGLANDFKQKGLKYTNVMPLNDDYQSGQGRSWKSTLSVEDQKQAEGKLASLGYSWQWLADGSLKAVTPILPAVVELNSTKSVYYNQLIAAYMGWQGVREDPSKAITFGDNSVIPVKGLELVVELAKKYTYDLNWQDGDVALVDNKMTMHGRRPFTGTKKRQILVTLTT